MSDWMKPEVWLRGVDVPDPLGIRRTVAGAWGDVISRLVAPLGDRDIEIATERGRFRGHLSELRVEVSDHWLSGVAPGSESIERVTGRVTAGRWNEIPIHSMELSARAVQLVSRPRPEIVTGRVDVRAHLLLDDLAAWLGDLAPHVTITTRPPDELVVAWRARRIPVVLTGTPELSPGRAHLKARDLTVLGRSVPLPAGFDLGASFELSAWPDGLAVDSVEVGDDGLIVVGHLTSYRRRIRPRDVLPAFTAGADMVRLTLRGS
ncbi:MAG: hypothetical protein ACE5GB_10330 [Acidimicrobiales bacterium]